MSTVVPWQQDGNKLGVPTDLQCVDSVALIVHRVHEMHDCFVLGVCELLKKAMWCKARSRKTYNFVDGFCNSRETVLQPTL